MRISSSVGLLLIAVCTLACEAEYPEGRLACDTADDCPGGWVCEQRSDPSGARCYRRAQDAATMDACTDGGACVALCTTNSDCNNNTYCDGAERCDPSDELADEAGCVSAPGPIVCDDGVACTVDTCSDALTRCTYTTIDVDEDGHGDAACIGNDGEVLGDDCDDADHGRFPGNPEVCDANGVDEDCDPFSLGFKDSDGDGAIDAMCRNTDSDGTTRFGLDCDDEDLAVHAFQPEFCDGIDNDCDDATDEVQNAVHWYADEDMDGFGAGEPVITSCTPQPGRSLLANDCDDTDVTLSPGEPDICDGVDNNCNGTADERTTGCATAPEPDVVLPINECVNGLADCSDTAMCSDTTDAFTCACPSGFSGSARGDNGCVDENECLSDNGGCDTDPMATCENQAGMPRTCQCSAPFEGSGIGVDGCVDGNPCLVNNGGCDADTMATCHWVVGSDLTCQCPAFYEISSIDGTACVDVNECQDNNGGCGSASLYRCINNIGAVPTCETLDLCEISNGGCDTTPMATCAQNGATITCDCPTGSFGVGMGENGCTPCTAITNCASGLTCSNASNQVCGTCVGGYVGSGSTMCMTCGSGTFASGNSCVDCGTIGGCAATETCNASNGSGLVCPTCASGYSGSGSGACTNINECLTGNGGCDTSPMATCIDSPGSRVCACPGDYVGDGIGDNGCTGIERGTAPTLSSASTGGPYTVASYTSGFRDGPDFGAATIYRPTNASAPFAMVVIGSGFTATQTAVATWGPFLASHGIVTMTIDTNSANDAVPLRTAALLDALVSLRAEHTRTGSVLQGQLDLDRAGIMGWSMGGGAAWLASSTNPSLRSVVSMCGTLSGTALTASAITVPTLMFAGSADSGVLGLGQSQPVYQGIPTTTSKMLFEVAGGDHYIANNPANQSGAIGRYGLSWLKVFLEGDERYRQFLLMTPPNASDFRTNLP